MLKMRILYLLWLNARGGLLAFTEPSACTTNSTSTSVKSAAPVQRSRSGMGKMIGVEHIYCIYQWVSYTYSLYNGYITNGINGCGGIMGISLGKFSYGYTRIMEYINDS